VRAGRDANPGLFFDMTVECRGISPVPALSLFRARFSLFRPPLSLLSN